MPTAILSSIVLSCSGPGAMAAINNNIWKSVLLAAIAAVFVLLAWVSYRQLREKVSLLLAIFCSVALTIHPAWTISALVGDCGISKLAGSKFFTSSIGVIFALQICWWLWQRKLRVEK
ncbi:MAG TPA: hypothetical protein PLD20_17150 [Blastocatellia bacterium]|nr:hypothetical protein [Blastocatellia bacterium]HMV84340.1 hypothetical protein [Blastocatellia bacterium]HMX26964.1 hypothetical protein [Blastocatellia bacterium]HMY75966.1 hypothetical protein [Blastocatellia bacterium]HMZ19666.1 hypothetical protein [Blastocatellia bacterium]